MNNLRSDLENSFFIIRKHVENLASKEEFSFDILNARLGRNSQVTVNAAFSSKIKQLFVNDRPGSYLNYKYTLQIIENFAGKEIPFSAVTPEWLERFEHFLLSSGKSYTSISIYCRTLRCILNQARNDGFLSDHQYPFGIGKYEIPKGNSRKMALTLEQIKQVVRYTDGKTETEEFRDLWFFSYLCNGINFMDLLLLKYSNIVDGEICFVRAKTSRTAKTKREIRAIITPEMQQIIDRWGNPSHHPDTCIFKYLTGDESPFEKKRVVKNITKRCNHKLKQIATALHIERLSTYTARHSYATVLKRSGANIAYISESLGHSNLSVTEAYLDRFEIEERIKNARLLTNFDRKSL